MTPLTVEQRLRLSVTRTMLRAGRPDEFKRLIDLFMTESPMDGFETRLEVELALNQFIALRTMADEATVRLTRLLEMQPEEMSVHGS